MAKTFWTTFRRRRPSRRKRLIVFSTVLVLLAMLGLVPQAQAFPIIGGIIKGLGGLFGGLLSRLGLGGLFLFFGGQVHDYGREELQKLVFAEEQAQVALLDQVEEKLDVIKGHVAVWDTLRVAWHDEYLRQLTPAPAFAYVDAPDQQRHFEESLVGRHRSLIRFMDDPGRTRRLWTGFDARFQPTRGDPLAESQQATEAALGAQTGMIALMAEEHRAYSADADEIDRFKLRIDTLEFENQMRGMKAQGLLLEIKQLQQLRYQVVEATARRAAAYGDELGAEARRQAAFERLLAPARRSPN